MRKLFLALIALATGGLLLVACSSGSNTTSSPPTGGTKTTGGVVTFAEPPSATPNWIFPFETAQYDTVNNVSQFQYLLYRPLYMFGGPASTSPGLNTSLSLADTPTFTNSDSQAVINMKNFMWSNGESVSANDVLFFMNMLHAQTANWYSYVPGLFPDNVKSVTVNSPTQITVVFKKSFNPNWLTDDEFSQITPFPKAWDITAAGAAAGSGGCSTGTYGATATDTACTAVYNFLNSQASNLAGYATSPIWSTVDGPWKLSSFDSSGDVTMVPNSSYSGPQKPTISAFKEVPFTTDDAEFNALIGGQVDVGYLPQQDITQSTTSATASGPNNPRVSSDFTLSPWVLFGYNYATYKLISNGDSGAAGPIMSQLYFRQAMQELVDQPLYISKLLKGYGVPTYGPVPTLPSNSYVDSFEQKNPLPYNPTTAKSLLSSHGWKVVPNGTDTCIKPGTGSDECGAGIPAGTPLSFTFAYATGTSWQAQTIEAEKSSWDSAGINITLDAQVFNTVVSTYAPACANTAACSQEMGWWGGGWVYAPDFLPTGELLFETGAANNSSNYSDPMADSLIAGTNDTNVSLNNYEDYLATHVPVLWQPNADYAIAEVRSTLRGVAPLSSVATLFPESYYYVK